MIKIRSRITHQWNPKENQKLAQFNLPQPPDSLNYVFLKWDERTLVVTTIDYKTVWGNLEVSFLTYHDIYSITPFHMKKRGTILFKMKYLNNKTEIEKGLPGFFLLDHLFLSCKKKLPAWVGARQNLTWRRIS